MQRIPLLFFRTHVQKHHFRILDALYLFHKNTSHNAVLQQVFRTGLRIGATIQNQGCIVHADFRKERRNCRTLDAANSAQNQQTRGQQCAGAAAGNERIHFSFF